LILSHQISDDTKDKIQEKRKSIKTLISKIRSRLEKKKSGKLVMEKSAGASPAKMMAAQIECAASKIKVDHCHSSYNHGNIIKTRMSVIRVLKAAALA
jgi:ABC-type antimicrobial peptide transport system ATPase subunit